VTLKELGLDHPQGYHITDLYDDYDYGVVTPDRRFKVDVNPSGSELAAKMQTNFGAKPTRCKPCFPYDNSHTTHFNTYFILKNCTHTLHTEKEKHLLA